MSVRRSRTPVPRTVGGLVRNGSRRFRAAGLVFGHGTGSARDEAAYLAAHALGLAHDATRTTPARRVGLGEANRVLDLFERRIRSRKPAAYLTREAWLAGNRFYVDERVIVPRSHIAGLLPDRLDAWLPGTGEIRTALDLCTGSGCLAVLLAKRFPRARIDAADISRDALAVARINVRRHRLDRRIRLVESDMFSALRGKRYELIVCNPPYVTTRRMQRLPREYRHEPPAALAGGLDGLDVVRRLLGTARRHLVPGGLLVVEVGSARGAVERVCPRLPFIWLDTPGGGDVFLLTREGLARATRAPASRAR